MRKLCLILIIIFLFCGCSRSIESRAQTAANTPAVNAPVDRKLEPYEEIFLKMTTEEKVGQLFLVAVPNGDNLSAIKKYQFGGLVLFGDDVTGKNPESLRAALSDMQSAAGVRMLIAVDEEGGSVCRISSSKAFRASRFPAPRKLLASGGLPLLLQTEEEKSQLLKSLGINVNLAPVCDITTNPSAFMYARSLGQAPEATANAIAEMVGVMNRNKLGSVLKHFPGYGNNTDTHVAMAIDNRPLSDLETVDLIPFQSGINAGCGAIMVSHTIVTAMDPDHPATLSPAVHQYLRQNMRFDGVIITDDLDMDAISDHYGAGEAAVLAVLAGNDMLCAWSYKSQYDAVLEAVASGRITQQQLDSSVLRILRWKQQLGLIG